MKAPWTTQVASDVVRDGLGLELIDGSKNIAAEVFRCDTSRTVTVRVFESGIPNEVLTELVEQARTRLAEFEDGTPLPREFLIEHAV